MEHHKDQREKTVKLLQSIKEKQTPASAKPLDLRGISLSGEDLREVDLSCVDLSNADLSGSNLSGANLFRAKLSHANLQKANLDGTELSGADLTAADMEEVSAINTGLGMACMRETRLFNANLEGSTLSKADLEGADLRCVSLQSARVREANLSKTDFTNANLHGADMSLCNVNLAIFMNAVLSDTRLRLIRGYEKANWIGVDIRNINFSGAYLMRRFIVDQNYLEEFRRASRLTAVLYYIWWLTSDCGRSLTRWFALIILQILIFSWLYTIVGVDYGDHPTFLSPFYYSVVTLTTLGYGDIVPASAAAQVIAMLEVCLGYTMLGGLLSILSNKMARRAD
ncbi:MAG: hypothetical protein GY721_05075 [Deltaproteobacteria bacterium]|nr:hypothetical protein [Deltaproteobacteria bacterium]